MKLFLRRLLNIFVFAFPKRILRHVLKSISYQPTLQDKLRYHVHPYRYDSPIPTRFDVDLIRLQKKRNLPCVELQLQSYLALVQKLKKYASEFSSNPRSKTKDAEFWFRNFGYEDYDAICLYCMIRYLKPKRIIEVGCGFSSRVISMAIRKNIAEGNPAECEFIEPYPPQNLSDFTLPGPLIQKKIEDIPLQHFSKLSANDILFIDTTHVIKTQSDCCYELLEIIPSLSSGVYIHIHDIFTPYDYPEEWIITDNKGFNEQYALECVLSGGDLLEIILPIHLLWRDNRDALTELLEGAEARPAAMWLRIGSK